MDLTSSIIGAVVQGSQEKLQRNADLAVQKKSMDLEKMQAAQKLSLLPEVPSVPTGGSIGVNIDVHA